VYQSVSVSESVSNEWQSVCQAGRVSKRRSHNVDENHSKNEVQKSNNNNNNNNNDNNNNKNRQKNILNTT
jgi:hypothetical protein